MWNGPGSTNLGDQTEFRLILIRDYSVFNLIEHKKARLAACLAKRKRSSLARSASSASRRRLVTLNVIGT